MNMVYTAYNEVRYHFHVRSSPSTQWINIINSWGALPQGRGNSPWLQGRNRGWPLFDLENVLGRWAMAAGGCNNLEKKSCPAATCWKNPADIEQIQWDTEFLENHLHHEKTGFPASTSRTLCWRKCLSWCPSPGAASTVAVKVAGLAVKWWNLGPWVHGRAENRKIHHWYHVVW